jgi:septin family protein
MDMKDRDEVAAMRSDIKLLLSTVATKDDLKEFATKDDLKEFATKDDLKGFATKDDLKGFATKDDLKAFATKDDLDVFATKDDLTGSHRKLALEIVKTNGRIDQLREDICGEMRIMSSAFHKKIDRFMSGVGKVDRAQIIADWRMTQIEKRVGAIESRPS